MPRKLHLPIYPTQPPIRAHWSLSIPSLTSPTTGKIIHAIGAPFTGYGLVFKRNYNLEHEVQKVVSILIGEVDDEYVTDTPGDGRISEDVDGKDRLELEAKKVDVPGVSGTPMEPAGGDECQVWMKKYIAWLVQRKLIDGSAIEVLEQAPIV